MSRVLPDEQCVFYGQLCARLSCVLWICSDNTQTDYSEQWKNYWDNGAPEVAVNCADCLVTFLIWFEWECVGVWQCVEKCKGLWIRKIRAPSLRAGCGTDIKVLRHSSCPAVPLLCNYFRVRDEDVFSSQWTASIHFPPSEEFGYKCSFLILLFSRQGAKRTSKIEDPRADLHIFNQKWNMLMLFNQFENPDAVCSSSVFISHPPKFPWWLIIICLAVQFRLHNCKQWSPFLLLFGLNPGKAFLLSPLYRNEL